VCDVLCDFDGYLERLLSADVFARLRVLEIEREEYCVRVVDDHVSNASREVMILRGKIIYEASIIGQLQHLFNRIGVPLLRILSQRNPEYFGLVASSVYGGFPSKTLCHPANVRRANFILLVDPNNSTSVFVSISIIQSFPD